MSEATCDGHAADSWSGRSCNRDLKTDDQVEAGLCGRHLAGKRRRAATDEVFRKQRLRGRELQAKAEAVVERLKTFGVESTPDYNTTLGSIGYTGSVVIGDGDALADLLEESS